MHHMKPHKNLVKHPKPIWKAKVVRFLYGMIRSVAQAYLRQKLGHGFGLLTFWTKFWASRPLQLGKYTVVHEEFESDLPIISFFDQGSKS